MGRFSRAVAQLLSRAGFAATAGKLLANGWLVEGKSVDPATGADHVKMNGDLFDLASRDGVEALAKAIDDIRFNRSAARKAVRTKRPPVARPADDRNRAAAAVVVAAIEANVAPFRDNRWFPLTAPYRLLNKALGDKKVLHEIEHGCPGASARHVADSLLLEAGFSEAFRSRMERLTGLELSDVICDVWSALATPSAQRWRDTVELLASVGACPLPGREEALKRSLPGLLARLLAMDLAVRDTRAVLHSMFGKRRDAKDLQLLKRVQSTAREEVGESAAASINDLLLAWSGKTTWFGRRGPGTSDDWSMLKAMKGVDPKVPDELMRSLLDAAVRHGSERKVYALPEVEYWVRVPDRHLVSLGIERLRFVELAPGVVRVVCAPTALAFPLEAPPDDITGPRLYVVLLSALTYAEMVTRRDRIDTGRAGTGQPRVDTWDPFRGLGHTTSRKPIRVGRVVRSYSPVKMTSHRSGTAASAVSYVVPHLRWLVVGQASASAVSEAAEHGISIPDGYTFVRGHFRGEGAGLSTVTYSVVDVALETLRRFQAKTGSGR